MPENVWVPLLLATFGFLGLWMALTYDGSDKSHHVLGMLVEMLPLPVARLFWWLVAASFSSFALAAWGSGRSGTIEDLGLFGGLALLVAASVVAFSPLLVGAYVLLDGALRLVTGRPPRKRRRRKGRRV